jgi:hypothetical protein
MMEDVKSNSSESQGEKPFSLIDASMEYEERIRSEHPGVDFDGDDI